MAQLSRQIALVIEALEKLDLCKLQGLENHPQGVFVSSILLRRVFASACARRNLERVCEICFHHSRGGCVRRHNVSEKRPYTHLIVDLGVASR